MYPHPSGIKRERESSEDDESDGYETDEYYDERGRKVVEIDYSKMPYVGPAKKREPPPDVPLTENRYTMEEVEEDGRGLRRLMKTREPLPDVPLTENHYTLEDMTPTVRDPLCQSSHSKLACFWPVYVDNFKGHQISCYFASKGLHVRWWFRREDAYFEEFQRKAKLFDQLVYFVSEKDAKLAVERCHRDMHKGYTLNVFPGREPVYFPEDRSVYAKNMKSGRVYSEHFFEKHVKFVCQVTVKCVVKFDMTSGALEFESPSHVAQAQCIERMWTYLPVKGKLQKQRYLEQDVLPEIEKFLAENPTALDMKKTDQYRKKLLRGVRPQLDQDQRFRVVPYRRGPTKYTQMKKWEKKMKWKFGVNGY